MNKKAKLSFICGMALTMLAVTTQQNVKADTTNNNQAISQATQAVTTTDDQKAVDTPATATDDTANAQENVLDTADTTSDQATTTGTNDQNADTQADSTASNITQIKGVATTKNQATTLYKQDGTAITDRQLGPNSAWYTDQKLEYNGKTYYRVATNEFTDGQDVVLTYGNAADGVIRVKSSGAVNFSRNDQGFVRNGQANQAANSVWRYNKTDKVNGLTYYQIANNVWLNSDDATTAAAYQNPNGWLQIHNSQIQSSGGAVGYDLYNGVEGIKTYLVRKYFGYSNAHTIYDGSVAASVRALQSRKGLPVTGVVNLATWKAMGFVESTWYGIDSYVAPLQTNITSTRSDHVEAMINQAYKYLGQPWISGAASMPSYGVDCSGLVTQALYASGIDSSPISNIQHAQPGHEWNSRDYWADNRLPRVNFNNRQRGDLIFFADSSTGVVWHVGILLNSDTMIESWPFAVQVHSIYSSRGNIVGVKRVFA
ncbi:peptidoglycan-binding protein [Companilactobacillus huachuanensis]|uniref:Peptidoglycan-binding protein n=1 Tax=Companilactobacillus huachuanensis TaxID=2559914 RepID=A0ABW1RP43_9LACO|nr:peptidoglycan-binding protein [Companilactobacillus huachuanensis]